MISDQVFADYQVLKLTQLRASVYAGLQDIKAGRSSCYDREGFKRVFEDIKSEGRQQINR